MASATAAQSYEVTQEVNWWITNRSREKMLSVFTEGEVFWNNADNDFDWHRTSAVPKDFSKKFNDEPFWVD